MVCAELGLRADIDSPIQPSSGSGASSNEPSADQIAMIADMGFSAAQARKALRETVSCTRMALLKANIRTGTPNERLNGCSPIQGTKEKKRL